jgi:AraC-like DNA-binding protein
MELNELYYCGLATAVFITTSLVVAFLRWFHMCHPYDHRPNYYYPGRPFFSAIFLNSLVLLPYALDPASTDAWYLTHIYFLPVTLYFFSILLYTYFGNIMEWRKWCTPMNIVGTPVLLCLIAALLVALWPGEQIGTWISPELAGYLLFIPGIISTFVCFTAIAVVRTWAKRFDEDAFSNPDDFPVKVARRWTFIVFVNLILCWTAVLLNSRIIMALIMLLFSASSVMIIISVLHPHRNSLPEEDEENQEPAAATETARKRIIPRESMLEIMTSIRNVVEEQQAYLEPHLTIQEVADRCGYSRSYIADIIKSEYGGFFDFINSFRLNHVTIYLQEHPNATIQEAAEASGFSSRQAYYSVKSRMEKAIPPIPTPTSKKA